MIRSLQKFPTLWRKLKVAWENHRTLSNWQQMSQTVCRHRLTMAVTATHSGSVPSRSRLLASHSKTIDDSLLHAGISWRYPHTCKNACWLYICTAYCMHLTVVNIDANFQVFYDSRESSLNNLLGWMFHVCKFRSLSYKPQSAAENTTHYRNCDFRKCTEYFVTKLNVTVSIK